MIDSLTRQARGKSERVLLFGEGVAFKMVGSNGNVVPCIIGLLALDWIQTIHDTKTRPEDTFDLFESLIEELAKRSFKSGKRDTQNRVVIDKDDVKVRWQEAGVKTPA